MKKRKPGKVLERAARAISDSDEFVDHVANICTRYRHEHALDAGPRASAVRQSLRTFQKHAAALAAWLEQAGKATSPEHDALDKIGSVLHGSPASAHAAGMSALDWLAPAAKAALRGVADAALTSRKPQRNAPRIAAEGLRATFEHHRLKWSTSGTAGKPADAVHLLCVIAQQAGDRSLTPDEGKRFLRESATRGSKSAG